GLRDCRCIRTGFRIEPSAWGTIDGPRLDDRTLSGAADPASTQVPKRLVPFSTGQTRWLE
ncbi:MAG: hypothetical protein R3178_04065, partial [Rhodothermales bacterium]|nr:hypothetical protein [Rhodothermales bacterium]